MGAFVNARNVVRALLLVAVVIAVVVSTTALLERGGRSSEAWAAFAAGLAVLAAVISAWTGQRVLELQEDALEPYPYPSIDARSRYQLVQFRITNYGGSQARDIEVKWEKALKDVDGEIVTLGVSEERIPVLLPGEVASVVLGVTHRFYSEDSDTTCSGTIQFKTASGRKRSHDFMISGEHERRALTFYEEAPKTHYELQKLPRELEKIRDQLIEIRKAIVPGLR